MSTTIFTAQQYDPAKARRRRQRILAVVSILIILAALGYVFRNWTYEHRVSQFFSLMEQKNYEQAYGMWLADPNWKQHPKRYPNYTFKEFYGDWGPGGEWGIIRSHEIVGSARKGSGVIVVVKINGRIETARLWVEKKDKTLTWSPY